MRRLANQTDILFENEIRQRRPIIRQSHAVHDLDSDIKTKTTKEQSENDAPGSRHLNSLWRAFTVRLLKALKGDIIANNETRRATTHY